METNYEYVNPYNSKYDYLMRIEHLGRYFFFFFFLKDFNNVLDIACADGYGTMVLSNDVVNVVGVDRNEE